MNFSPAARGQNFTSGQPKASSVPFRFVSLDESRASGSFALPAFSISLSVAKRRHLCPKQTCKWPETVASVGRTRLILTCLQNFTPCRAYAPACRARNMRTKFLPCRIFETLKSHSDIGKHPWICCYWMLLLTTLAIVSH